MINLNQISNDLSTSFLSSFKKNSKYQYSGYDKYGRLKSEVLEYLKMVENFDYSKKGMYRKVERIAEILGFSQRKIFNIRKFCNEANLTFTVKNTYNKLQTTSSIFLTDFCRAYFAELRRRAELRVLNPKIRSNNNIKNDHSLGSDRPKLLLEDKNLKLSESKPNQENPKIAMLESQVRSLSDKLEKAMMFLSTHSINTVQNVKTEPPLKEKTERVESIVDHDYLSRTTPLQRHIHASLVTLAKDVIGMNGIPHHYKIYITPDRAELISLSKTQMAEVIQHMIKNGRYISQSEIATPESFKKYFEGQYERMNAVSKERKIYTEQSISVPEKTEWTEESRREVAEKLRSFQNIVIESKPSQEKIEAVEEEIKFERKVPDWFSEFR